MEPPPAGGNDERAQKQQPKDLPIEGNCTKWPTSSIKMMREASSPSIPKTKLYSQALQEASNTKPKGLTKDTDRFFINNDKDRPRKVLDYEREKIEDDVFFEQFLEEQREREAEDPRQRFVVVSGDMREMGEELTGSNSGQALEGEEMEDHQQGVQQKVQQKVQKQKMVKRGKKVNIREDARQKGYVTMEDMTLEQLEEVIQQTRQDYERATQKLSEFKEGMSEALEVSEASGGKSGGKSDAYNTRCLKHLDDRQLFFRNKMTIFSCEVDKRKNAADECRKIDTELEMEEGHEPVLTNDKPCEQNHLYPQPLKLLKSS
ncbi:UNVERIFIED_CONTAM: hypothetical protein K2H54_056764 [Gekko kuhli]